MIQMLINLGKWLENRFPKVVQVTEQDYQQLKSKVNAWDEAMPKYSELFLKIENLESNAVHKEPVKLLVEEMAKMKAELVSLRAGLGITATASSPEAMEAMLNGVMLGKGDNNG